MNACIAVLVFIVCSASLLLFTLLISFYHCFEADREMFDRYTLIAVLVFVILFIVTFNILMNYGSLGGGAK